MNSLNQLFEADAAMYGRAVLSALHVASLGAVWSVSEKDLNSVKDVARIAASCAFIAHPELREEEAAVDPAMREMEASFAYSHTSAAIEAHCLMKFTEDEWSHCNWFDLTTQNVDLADEVAYLHSRRLLLVHPTLPGYVSICDEDEPLPEVAA